MSALNTDKQLPTKSNEKIVFVTVGTTEFDQLIETVTTTTVLKILKKKGFQKIVLQIGNGASVPPVDIPAGSPTVEYFRFKKSLQDDIKNAELVISHAGAGSVLEALEAKKMLLVVVNENLMNNHQLELAQQFHSTGHLSFCNCRNLPEVLAAHLQSPSQYIAGDPLQFSRFINQIMGY